MADTIAAVATGGGVSAIGIIRISGDRAIDIAASVFRPKSGKSVPELPDRKLVIGDLTDREGRIIDSCLITVSRAPNTYTGEDTAEFQCHGSPTVLSEGLLSLFSAGARQAGPGEFTKRAFLNGRMDLTQAEAVADIIEAETAEAAVNATGQLSGAVSRRTDKVYDALRELSAHFHAVIDYPDEDIDEFDMRSYLVVLEEAENELDALLRTFSRGRIMKDGVLTAIIGRPNVGKSSLLNALLGFDRAIVTDVPGTTRDVIEEKIRLGRVVLRLSDTAGLRQTDDKVERLGVERSEKTAKSAELVIAVFDGSQPISEEDMRVTDILRNAPRGIAVINKSDLPPLFDKTAFSGRAARQVSAKTGDGLSGLCGEIEELFSEGSAAVPVGEILTNARQAESVERALSSVREAKNAAAEEVTPDAVLTVIEDAMSALGEITGRTIRADIAERIFERFCVGK